MEDGDVCVVRRSAQLTFWVTCSLRKHAQLGRQVSGRASASCEVRTFAALLPFTEVQAFIKLEVQPITALGRKEFPLPRGSWPVLTVSNWLQAAKLSLDQGKGAA